MAESNDTPAIDWKAVCTELCASPYLEKKALQLLLHKCLKKAFGILRAEVISVETDENFWYEVTIKVTPEQSKTCEEVFEFVKNLRREDEEYRFAAVYIDVECLFKIERQPE
jgi:hypothetical protein